MSAVVSLDHLGALRDRYLEAQLRGDRRAARAIVFDEALAGGVSVLDVYEHVLAAAQREIGRLWQENEVSVAEEHVATAISNLILAQLFEHASHAPRNGKRVLVACVEGELHEFPARLVADALDLAGFQVVFVGANVPTESLLPMIEREKPDLVALSITMSFHAGSLREAVAAIRHRFGPRLPIAAGGHALEWGAGIAAELGIDVTSRSAAELVVAMKQRLGVDG
ncbi:MAG: cobalamin-dependent protein [Deltaproteobacteria bacterium]|nr:cobalamin-dependent protein [Deltaproteobacteria bacterium]